MVHAPHEKLVVLQGLDDFIVVDTPDVLLICKKENEQQVKDFLTVVKKIKAINIYSYPPRPAALLIASIFFIGFNAATLMVSSIKISGSSYFMHR